MKNQNNDIVNKIDETLKADEALKRRNEGYDQTISVEETVSDGSRAILICSLYDDYGNKRYINLPVFSSIYTAQEWARRDLYSR